MNQATALDRQLDRMPPQSLEAEQAVLGAVLRDNDRLAQVSEVVTHEGMFYRQPHRLIWRSMRELYRSAEPIDLLTLQEKMRQAGTLAEAGGVSYLAKLLDCTPTAGHAFHHAKILREKAVLRGTIHAGCEMVTQAYEDDGDADEMLDGALKALVDIRAQADPGGMEPADKVLVRVMGRLDGKRRGLPTGFFELDELVSGLEAGHTIVIGARPSIGKTAFALSLSRYLTQREEPIDVAYFSLEMTADDIGFRLLAAEAQAKLYHLMAGRLDKCGVEHPRLLDAAGRLSERPIQIDGTPALTATQIRGRIWQLKARLPELGLVVVDHVGLVRAEDRRLGRERQVAEASEILSQAAKEQGVVMVVLAQLNREVETQPEKKPSLANLRESGSLEQNADTVFLLHRPGFYVELRKRDPEEYDPAKTTVIVAKQRNGPTGEAKVRFNTSTCRFETGL